jgi:hypothetical protein
VCFFSATLHSPAVRDLSNEICYQPLWIDLRGKDNSILPETVHHCLVEICPDSFNESAPGGMIVTDACHRQGDLNKKIKLTSLSAKDAASERIKQLKPRAVKDIIDTFRMDQVLVFCRTNLDCDLLQKYFQTCADTNEGRIASGYSCRVLAGMRSMVRYLIHCTIVPAACFFCSSLGVFSSPHMTNNCHDIMHVPMNEPICIGRAEAESDRFQGRRSADLDCHRCCRPGDRH